MGDMSHYQTDLQNFLSTNPHAVLIEIIDAKGSTPREKETWMLVSQSNIFGTIGGGQLEYIAIDKARQLLKICGSSKDKTTKPETLNILLGPEIGQCCGGSVSLLIAQMDELLQARLVDLIAQERAAEPHLYIFGAGHVGFALAKAASLLPLKVKLIDTRAEELAGAPIQVEAILSAIPEAIIRSAIPKSAYVILTHDHALDFLLAKEALERGDAAYIGMIGSKTKRGTFTNWFKREGGHSNQLKKLTCPIGGTHIKDKRPEIIAALTLAEVISHCFVGRSLPINRSLTNLVIP